jgi:2-polyprenyl-3-methyl-5-hydroxy-6-metoxy-1,4-benzoquinol methylase
MKKNPNLWYQIWNEPNGFDPVMKTIMPYFAKQIRKQVTFNRKDRILDIGCGPGYFEEFIAGQVQSIHGIDISPRYAQMCSEKFKGTNCSFFSLDSMDYLNFNVLGNNTYTKVIALSTLQYFSSVDDVRLLVSKVRAMLEPGGMMVIADVVSEEGTAQDTWDLFFYLISRGKLFTFIRFAHYILTSDYRKTRKQLKLLTLPRYEWVKMSEEMNFRLMHIRQLTIHRKRDNYLITFQST